MTLREQLLSNPFFEYRGNIFYQKNFRQNNSFERAYLKLRTREGRILSDDAVKMLPDVRESHPNKREWQMRKSSLREVIRSVKKSGAKKILEIGCGNGWFSHNVMTSAGAEICAIDINETELVQGARVFREDEELSFAYANIFSNVFESNNFDAAILSSSVQYFPNLETLFSKLFELLRVGGCIYIVDSPFYTSKSDAEEARKRSKKHFNSLNASEMVDQYFHHTFDDLKCFNYSILYNPKSLTSFFKRKVCRVSLSIFPVIRISYREKFVNA